MGFENFSNSFENKLTNLISTYERISSEPVDITSIDFREQECHKKQILKNTLVDLRDSFCEHYQLIDLSEASPAQRFSFFLSNKNLMPLVKPRFHIIDPFSTPPPIYEADESLDIVFIGIHQGTSQLDNDMHYDGPHLIGMTFLPLKYTDIGYIDTDSEQTTIATIIMRLSDVQVSEDYRQYNLN